MKRALSLLTALLMTVGVFCLFPASLFADDPDAGTMHIEPMYDVIENTDGRTCFIVGGTTPEISNALRRGTFSLKVTIVDETERVGYVIEKYVFDEPSYEIYSDNAFLRICACKYGIVPLLGHFYTIGLEVTDSSGKLRYSGVSEKGAFDEYNENFMRNGAIVYANPPYTHTLMNFASVLDLDGSGAVNTTDLTALLDVIAGSRDPATGAAADYDYNGSVNIKDATRFLSILEDGGWYTRNEADSGWTLCAPAAVSGEITVPGKFQGEPVTQIAPYAFANCKSATKITVPAAVTWIGEYAFSGCASLKEIDYGGKASTFYAGGATLPEGCKLVCAEAEDPINGANYKNCKDIADLSGYDGILRVKTTEELLFSPTLTELRNLVSNGADYEDYLAYLRFSDATTTYPVVTVEPVKSKGAWVDFFLQGEGIDCGFCPTAGMTYDIEFVLVKKSAPTDALYSGVYTATAGDDFAESKYYNPTPLGQGGEERKFFLRYVVDGGGRIVGEAEQFLKAGETASPVTAVADKGYEFISWSDGVTTPARSGDTITKSTTLRAHFSKVYVSNLASVYIYTSTGQPIRSKEYIDATITVRGAEKEEYNISAPMTIKGRGNSSFDGGASQSDYNSKNSYSIKLEEKENLLGTGKDAGKKWVLNANKFDASGLRNYLVWDLAARMGTIPFVPGCSWVQLYINDEYRGMYALTEKVNTAKSRVNVDDDPTGNPDKGYLLELDFRGQSEDEPWFDVNGYGPDPRTKRYDAVEFVIKSDVEGQQDIDFISDYVQRCHDAIMAGTRTEIEKLVDLPSLIDMYIIEELSKDCDAGRASFYVCKDTGGKLFFTAPWDFDFGFGTYGPATNTWGLVSTGDDCCTWFASLVTRSWFRRAVLSRMAELDDVLQQTLSAVREKGEFLRDDADRNAEFWNLYGRHYHAYVSGSVSTRLYNYDEHIDYIENWTNERWANLKTELRDY